VKLNQKNIYKPIYKKLLKLKENVLNKDLRVFLKLKKKKWQFFIKKLLKKNNKIRFRYEYPHIFLGVYRYFDYYRHVLQYNCGTARKNKFKFFMQNKQLFNFYYNKRAKTNLAKLLKNQKNFLSKIESRLDVIFYRSKFCTSIRNARQLIKHKHVLVNNIITTNYSQLINQGDTISVKKDSKEIVKNVLIRSQLWPLPLQYLTINYKTLEILLNDNITEFNSFIYFPFWFNINRIKNHNKTL
jgi:ribosomal protein S4